MTRRPRLSRRAALAAFAAVSVTAPWAFAGSYLNRAAILLESGDNEAKLLSRRFFDKELARVTHRLALARAEAARDMEVPEEVTLAHPHLLLALESYERSSDAAVRNNHEEFLVALSRAREESRIFVAVLKQSGWSLPNVS